MTTLKKPSYKIFMTKNQKDTKFKSKRIKPKI